MRKFFVFALVALVVVAMAVPAFASEINSYVFPIVGGTLADLHGAVSALDVGSYNVVIYDSNNNVIGENVADVVYENGFFYYIMAGNYNGTDVKLELTVTNDPSNDYVYYGDLLEIDDGNVVGPIGINGKVVFTPVASASDVSPTESIFTVFGGIGTYLMAALTSLVAIFWTGTSLTFVGVLSVCALALALILLLIGIIRRLF